MRISVWTTVTATLVEERPHRTAPSATLALAQLAFRGKDEHQCEHMKGAAALSAARVVGTRVAAWLTRGGALLALLAYLVVPCCSSAAAARAGQQGSEARRRGGEAAGRRGGGSGASSCSSYSSSSSSSLSTGGRGELRGAGGGRSVSLGASGDTGTGQRAVWARAWDQIYRSSSNHGGTGGSLSPQNSGISCVGHHSTPRSRARPLEARTFGSVAVNCGLQDSLRRRCDCRPGSLHNLPKTTTPIYR